MNMKDVYTISAFLPGAYGRAKKQENITAAYDFAAAMPAGMADDDLFAAMGDRGMGNKTKALAATMYYIIHNNHKYATYLSGGGGYSNPHNAAYDPSYTPPEAPGVYCRWTSVGDAWVGDSGGAIHVFEIRPEMLGSVDNPGRFDIAYRAADSRTQQLIAGFFGFDFTTAFSAYCRRELA